MERPFFYEDGQDNLYNEQGVKVYDPMEGILTEINDPNVILQRVTTGQSTWKELKLPERIAVEKIPKIGKNKKSKQAYKQYSDRQREDFIDRMIESAQERGLATKFAKELGIEPRVAQRWWKAYKETGEAPYKKSISNPGPKSTFTDDHNDYLRDLVDDDPQLAVDDIVVKLAEKFEDFSISKSQLNHHLKNNMCLTVKKPTFEAEARNDDTNLQTRYNWFMQWKDSDLDFTKNCVFIDEAGFNINMRNNWARSAVGTRAIVTIPKTRAPSHSVIGAIHSSNVLHIVLKKTTSKKTKGNSTKTKGNPQKK